MNKFGVSIYVVSLLISAVIGYMWPSHKNESDLREQNTKIIQLFGELADDLYNNSDIMARFSHYTDNHQQVVTFCPECFNGNHDNLSESGYRIVPPEEIIHIDSKSDATLYDDTVEIIERLQRIQSSLGTQKVCLTHTLNVLRETNGYNDSNRKAIKK